MRYPSLFVDRTVRREPVRAVKAERMHLGGQQHFPVAALACGLHKAPQERPADASAAPRLHHRHAADVAVGEKATGADGLVLMKSQSMKALRVHLIHLQLGGHALLLDEYGEADALCLRLGFAPGPELDSQHFPKSIIGA